MRIQFTPYNHYEIEFITFDVAERAREALENAGIRTEYDFEWSRRADNFRHTVKFMTDTDHATRMRVLSILEDFE